MAVSLCRMNVCLSDMQSVCHFVCLFVCVFFRLSVCLFICLSEKLDQFQGICCSDLRNKTPDCSVYAGNPSPFLQFLFNISVSLSVSSFLPPSTSLSASVCQSVPFPSQTFTLYTSIHLSLRHLLPIPPITSSSSSSSVAAADIKHSEEHLPWVGRGLSSHPPLLLWHALWCHSVASARQLGWCEEFAFESRFIK